jgi:hypothetical protein
MKAGNIQYRALHRLLEYAEMNKLAEVDCNSMDANSVI